MTSSQPTQCSASPDHSERFWFDLLRDRLAARASRSEHLLGIASAALPDGLSLRLATKGYELFGLAAERQKSDRARGQANNLIVNIDSL